MVEDMNSKQYNDSGLFRKEQVLESLRQSFVKLDPRVMVKNPVMFTVEVAAWVMTAVTLYSAVDDSQGSFLYNLCLSVVLLFTLFFANFAEAIAEACGKAQADSLRKTREKTPAKVLLDGRLETVDSSRLKKGDVFECEAGDIIPADGEIIWGLASIDESAITGESAPVIREAGGDKSSVTGGTKVLSDRIRVEVTCQPGESFLDKMISLVEGAGRQKTPNEIALTILLAVFTLIFLVVCITLKPLADYSGTAITVAAFISLFVCLIPTTIGGLLSAIGIAGMDRALRANVITKSGKVVETAGDIDTLLLDKTGTITIGNRKATAFHPAEGVDMDAFVEACMLSSVADETPEGKSIVELGRKQGMRLRTARTEGAHMIRFTAETLVLDGRVVGVANVGQSFTEDIYFWGRPSCAGDGYDASASAGSNKGAADPEYLREVEGRIVAFLKSHPYLKREEVPAEMVTANASGLDPDITPECAYVQVRRVAEARGVSEGKVREIVERQIEKPLFGWFGPARVNVLKLNVALERECPGKSRNN